jgi:predicted protein tyrosine phosphatase
MIKKVMFVSRTAIENLSGDWTDFALISIIEPNAVGVGKINDRAFKRVIHSNFHDVVTGRVYDEPVVEMDIRQAMSMVSFLHQIENEIDGVLVNCRAGISRSAAVAKWICESRGLPFNANYNQYNPHVYKLLLDAEATWKRSNA